MAEACLKIARMVNLYNACMTGRCHTPSAFKDARIELQLIKLEARIRIRLHVRRSILAL